MMVYAIRFCGLAVLGAHLGNPAAAPDPVAEGYVHCKDPGHDEDSISREADALDHGPRDDSSRYDGEGPYTYIYFVITNNIIASTIYRTHAATPCFLKSAILD